MSTDSVFMAADLPTADSRFRCGRCNDLGVWLTPVGVIAECPVLQLGQNDHAPLSDAAKTILRAGRLLAERKVIANPNTFRIARALSRVTTDKPLSRQDLIDGYFQWSSNSGKLRELHSTIEELRSVWLLPIGSRKSMPYGYWIITDESDFRVWVRRSIAAPVKQLATIRAVARANFSERFVEQLELDFDTAEVEAWQPQ